MAICVLVIAEAALAQTSSQPNWSAKADKSGDFSARQVSPGELTSIAERLHKSGVLSSGHQSQTTKSSSLATLLQSGRSSQFVGRALKFDADNMKISYDARVGTPIFISNLNVEKRALGLSSGASDQDIALSYIDQNKGIFLLDDPPHELTLIGQGTDRLGARYTHFQQTYRGLPVWGREIVVHFRPDGNIRAVNGRYLPTPRSVDLLSTKISRDEAITIVWNDLGENPHDSAFTGSLGRMLKYNGPSASLCIWADDNSESPRKAWFTEIRPNLLDDWYYFIDAITGQILDKYSNTKSDGPTTASAVDLNGVTQTIHTYLVGSQYYLIDGSRPIWQVTQPDIVNDPRGALWTETYGNTDDGPAANITSLGNTWTDPAAVSAQYNVGETFQYYYSSFGRMGIDDSGTTILSFIHITSEGESVDGAFWGDGYMIYGDGGQQFYPLAGGLDVAAHEMTHGVIQHTVNLKYENQSGALNESFADVFACMVDRADWHIGEDIVKPAVFPSGALRNLADPHNGGNSYDYYWQPATMSEYVSDTSDHGMIHTNSGIPNHAAYLIGQAIGRDELEQIYYHILEAHYLTTEAQFVDMRLAAIQSATDLYWITPTAATAVESAFDAVGIFDGTPTTQPPDEPAVVGDEWVAVVNAEAGDNSLYKAKPDSSSTIVQLSGTQVLASSGRPISVSSDGSGIVFIDSSHYIRVIGTDGVGEQVISASGEWYSLTLSPDGSKLATTSIYEDSSIYVFDLTNPDSTKVFRLYCPTTVQGTSSYITRYADVLDWNMTGEYLVYDALSSIPQSGGGSIDTWSIFILEVSSGRILSLFPPLPPGIQMGDPAFAHTNDIYVVSDLIDDNSSTDYIYAVNLFSGQQSVVENNGTSIGYPDYSTDDSRIVFDRFEAGRNSIRQINLGADRISPSGLSYPWLLDAALPVWFVVPSPVDVPDSTANEYLPASFTLTQNYPNPFNPSTTIEYSLPRRSHVTIDIYNMLGQKVCTLVDRDESAGDHSAVWDGTEASGESVATGIYLYRLQAGDRTETKKMLLLK